MTLIPKHDSCRSTAPRPWLSPLLQLYPSSGAVLLALLVSAGAARAQGAARVLDLDLSIRSAGSGGACNAVFWGGDPNDWANPALVAYHEGIRFTQTKTRLVPGLAPGVWLRSRRITIGSGGVGVVMPGDLNGYGSTLLEYGTFESFERVRAWGVGASLAGMIASSTRAAGKDPPRWLRYGDIAAGYADKQVRLELTPPFAGETNARDFGVLIRATPLDRMDIEDEDARLPARVDLAYGYSVINYNDASVFDNPTSRIFRSGLALHAALDAPRWAQEWLGERDWLIRSLSPLISIGFANDWEHVQAGDGDAFGEYDVTRWGGEVIAANILSVRTGHVRDREGDIIGSTSGWGVGFRLAGVAGFRHDWASIPQASGLPRVKRRGFTAFIHPLALVRWVGGARGS